MAYSGNSIPQYGGNFNTFSTLFLQLLLHGPGGLLQLGNEGPQLLRLLPLVLNNMLRSLGGEGFVIQLGLDTLEMALGLGLLLGDTLQLLLDVHQLGKGHEGPGGVGDNLHHALSSGGGIRYMDLAGSRQTLEEGRTGSEGLPAFRDHGKLDLPAGATFISALRVRMARIRSMISSIAASSAG